MKGPVFDKIDFRYLEKCDMNLLVKHQTEIEAPVEALLARYKRNEEKAESQSPTSVSSDETPKKSGDRTVEMFGDITSSPSSRKRVGSEETSDGYEASLTPMTKKIKTTRRSFHSDPSEDKTALIHRI
jgi:hypothetical protein